MPSYSSIESVPYEWFPGDVILDIYEVHKVKEPSGSGAVDKEFHEGGFGRVYKIWHKAWSREMAVKVPRRGLFVSQDQRDAFIKECETWIHLGLHAHIAVCHYVRDLGGVPRVFSEYAEAGTLEDWIRTGRLYFGDEKAVQGGIIDVAIQLAWGLHYAHEKGVIHQDIKPLNALMWNDGTLKVTDFGLASGRQTAGLANANEKLCSIQVSCGGMTPAYCSPEQAARLKLDRRTDMWSWAVSLMQIYNRGVSWYSGITALDSLGEFLECKDKRRGYCEMPSCVAEMLRQCFAPNPVNRPRSMLDCVEVLKEHYSSLTGVAYNREEPGALRDTPDSLNNRALSYIDLGKYDEADACFSQARSIDKMHFATAFNSGLFKWRRGLATDVDFLGILAPFTNDKYNVPMAVHAMSRLRREFGDFESAAKESERVTGQKNPQVDERQAIQSGMDVCLRMFKGHRETVTALSFSADGRLLVSGSRDGICQLWDSETGECVRTYEGHRGSVNAIIFGNDDKTIFSCSDDGSCRLWAVDTGECFHVLRGKGNEAFICVALSQDGCSAVAGNIAGCVCVWDLGLGSLRKSFRVAEPASKRSMTISADARTILCATEQDLWLVDVMGETTVCGCSLSMGNILFVALSPDCRQALTGSDDESIRLWALNSGTCLKVFKLGVGRVQIGSVCFGGQHLIIGSNSGAHLVDVGSGQIRTFKDYARQIGCIALSPDGYRVVAVNGNVPRLWNISSVVADKSQTPWLYMMPVTASDLLARQNSHKLLLSKAEEKFAGGQIGESAKYIMSARSVPGYARDIATLDLQARIGARLRIKAYDGGWLKRIYQGHTSAVKAVSISPDGEYAVSGGYSRFLLDKRKDYNLRLWNIASGSCVHTFGGHAGSISSVAFSPDSSVAFASACDSYIESGPDGDFTFRAWDVGSGRCFRSFKGHTGGVNAIACSPDGSLIVSGGGFFDKTVRLWEVSTGQCIHVFRGHIESVESVAFSPDGRFVSSGSKDKSLRLWDVASGLCRRVFEGHTQAVSSVAFSPNGAFVLSGGGLDRYNPGKGNDQLRLFEVATGKCIHVMNGHLGAIKSVAFIADGRFAVSGSTDCGDAHVGVPSVCLWDLAAGKCLRSFEGHSGAINGLAVSPCGRYVLSGSDDKTVRMWEIDWEYE